MKLDFSSDTYKQKAAYVLSSNPYRSNLIPEDAFLLLINNLEFDMLENLCVKISNSISITVSEAYNITQNPSDDYEKRVILKCALDLVKENTYMGNKMVLGTNINTSSFISHSLNSAILACRLANGINLDLEYAFCYGLLHDYGRKFTHDFTHIIKGFEALSNSGYDDMAKGCLTHSFINGGRYCNNEVVNDSFCLDEKNKEHYDETDDMREVLGFANYSDYDMILNIVDLMASDTEIMKVIDRIDDIASRRSGIEDSLNRKYFYVSLYNLLIDFMRKLGSIRTFININLEYINYDSVGLDEVKEKLKTLSTLIYNVQLIPVQSFRNYEVNIRNYIDNVEAIPKEVTEIRMDYFDLDLINKIILSLKKRNINAKIICNLPFDSVGKDRLLKIMDKDYVLFSYSNEKKVSVDDMIKTEDTLDLFIKDIKESNLSLYEKYVAVYYLAKNIKQYNEDDPHSIESRSIYLILNNYSIVCSGYVNLFIELLKRIGINAQELGVVVDGEPHARAFVKLVDEKYGIDGIFFSDPTFDSISYKKGAPFFSYSNHMNMTIDEYSSDITYSEFFSDGLFRPMSDEEMYEYLKRYRLSNLQLIKIDSIDENFRAEVGYPKEITFDYSSKLNNYIKRNMHVKIPRKVQYQALMEVKQLIEESKYSLDEYEKEWYNLTNKDFSRCKTKTICK